MMSHGIEMISRGIKMISEFILCLLVQILMRTDECFLVIYFMRSVNRIERDGCTG